MFFDQITFINSIFSFNVNLDTKKLDQDALAHAKEFLLLQVSKSDSYGVMCSIVRSMIGISLLGNVKYSVYEIQKVLTLRNDVTSNRLASLLVSFLIVVSEPHYDVKNRVPHFN